MRDVCGFLDVVLLVRKDSGASWKVSRSTYVLMYCELTFFVRCAVDVDLVDSLTEEVWMELNMFKIIQCKPRSCNT